MSEHRIVEAMAATWDEQGHRAPRDWHISCLCGWWERDLKSQNHAFDAWRAHVNAATQDES